MSGLLWWDMRALEALIRDWLSKPQKLQGSRPARDRGAQGVSRQRTTAVHWRLWVWFWRQCMPPHTSFFARREV